MYICFDFDNHFKYICDANHFAKRIIILCLYDTIVSSGCELFFLVILSFCVVEFGVVGALNTYYPTTGFSAAYTLAHEIGKTKHFQSRK